MADFIGWSGAEGSCSLITNQMLYQLSYASLQLLLRRRRLAAPLGWSGRRESNPQPTAWKAVTLPLSYSRL